PAMLTGALACGAALPALAGAIAAMVPAPPARPHVPDARVEPARPDAAEAPAGLPWWRGARAGTAAAALAAIVPGAQLVHARWSPRRFIPTARDRAAGDALIERLRELRAGGDVFVPYHPWYARLAGQERTYVHRMGILDLTYGNRWRVRGLAEALREGRFA